MGAATLTVIGVMPAPFRGTHGDTDAWVPLMLAPLGIGRAGQPFPFWTAPSAHWMQLIARVARPEDLPAAREEFLGIYDRFARGQHWIADSTPQTDRAMPELLSIRDSRLDPIIVRAARSVDAAVFVLVLMTCANATLLFIAQLHGRARPIAIQLALGATRARTLAGLLAETTIIGGVAVIPGTGAAIGASSALARLTQHMPEVRVAGLDLAPAVWRSGIGSGSAIIGLLAIPLLAI